MDPRRVGVSTESRVQRSTEEPQEPADTGAAQRRHAVEYSEWYYKRLTIHKLASYTTIPLFVTEYILGDKLHNGTSTSSTGSAHQAVATGIAVLFGVNTVTGVWNLWESRHESQGRARRTTHAVLMLAADAGFVATAALAPGGENDFENSSDNRSNHRAVAVASMGVTRQLPHDVPVEMSLVLWFAVLAREHVSHFIRMTSSYAPSRCR